VENAVKEDLKKNPDQAAENQKNQDNQSEGKSDQAPVTNLPVNSKLLSNRIPNMISSGRKDNILWWFQSGRSGGLPCTMEYKWFSWGGYHQLFPGKLDEVRNERIVWTDALLKLPDNYTMSSM